MSHLSVYIITLADDAEDAKSKAINWMEDYYANREFFDYGVLEKPETVHLVKDITLELEKLKVDAFQPLPDIEKQIERCKAEKNRISEGYYHIRYGNILSEECCSDMPFFNISEWDWSIPTEVPEDADGRDWYAVMVDLHY
jgi:hypothetical protein